MSVLIQHSAESLRWVSVMSVLIKNSVAVTEFLRKSFFSSFFFFLYFFFFWGGGRFSDF